MPKTIVELKVECPCCNAEMALIDERNVRIGGLWYRVGEYFCGECGHTEFDEPDFD